MQGSINAKITVFVCLEEQETSGFFKTKTSKQEFGKMQLVEKTHLQLEKLVKEHDV